MAIDYVQRFKIFATEYAPKLIGALLVFVIGLWAVGWLTRIIKRGMLRRGFDISLQSFLASMMGVVLKVMLLVTVAGMMGIQTTSFVAILGAAGLAVGLALQGSLSNFAGGVLTLIFKPYKVGDVIEALGQTGVVQEIQIFNTILLTADHKTVILPNGAVSNGTIINHSRHGSLRIAIHLVLDGSTRAETIRSLAIEICQKNELVLAEPMPSVSVERIDGGNLGVVIHAYSEPQHQGAAISALQEELKTAMEKAGIKFPTPAA
jgi:small conductance mechanosensitive channel